MSVPGFPHLGSRRPATTLAALAVVALLGGTAGRAGEPADRQPPWKHLIEFGWDEPDTAFLRRHVAEMETTPVRRLRLPRPVRRPGGHARELHLALLGPARVRRGGPGPRWTT